MRKKIDNEVAQRLIAQQEPNIQTLFVRNADEQQWEFPQTCSTEKMSDILNRLLENKPGGEAFTGEIDCKKGEGADDEGVTAAKAEQAGQSATAETHETMVEALGKIETSLKIAMVAQGAQQDANMRAQGAQQEANLRNHFNQVDANREKKRKAINAMEAPSD